MKLKHFPGCFFATTASLDPPMLCHDGIGISDLREISPIRTDETEIGKSESGNVEAG
jgi:hypothetical protein